MKTVLIITDAWNQMNGVVTTFINTIKVLESKGYTVKMITPENFKTIPLPSYKEIKLAINPWNVSKLIEEANADYIHIATEGSIGLFAGLYCRWKKYKFTTSYHTKMPEYIKERYPFVPLWLSYAYMKLIHHKSESILVTTHSMKTELLFHGFKCPIVIWGRGVDTNIFHPTIRLPHKRPKLLYVGRVSVEKNIEAFLDLPDEFEKIVVGDGPQLSELKAKYATNESITFAGKQFGVMLADYYCKADVFVFPSKTDTFGIVMLEAMACGTPVVGFPVTGPIDCVENGVTGYLSHHLFYACREALKLNRSKVAEIGLKNTWDICTTVFERTLVPR